MRRIGWPAELERRRRLAVRRVEEGYSIQESAEFLDVDPSSVRRWVAASHEYGPAGLAARPVSGRPPKLTITQEKIVRQWLADNPRDHGFATELWTARRLGTLIEEEFGVHFHPHYLPTWLRQRDYTPQLPRRVAREQNESEIARWLAEDWPRIRRNARRRGASLILLDESGLLMAPLRRRSWALRGCPPLMEQKGRHREKVSVIGALCFPPRQDRLTLAYQTRVNSYFTNATVADFLRGGVQWRHTPLVVVWDGGSTHKGDPINQLIAESAGRLSLERLPAYAPELMPVEQLWTWLKYDRLCNFAPKDANDLNDAIQRELDPIRNNQLRLRNFVLASQLTPPRALLS